VLCRTPRGTLLRRDYYNRELWKPALVAAGLPADTTFHDLRHTFASTAQVSGVAFDATFPGRRERALPAAQRTALRRPRPAEPPRGCGDLGLHGPHLMQRSCS